jgi:hypothetical protein
VCEQGTFNLDARFKLPLIKVLGMRLGEEILYSGSADRRLWDVLVDGGKRILGPKNAAI